MGVNPWTYALAGSAAALLLAWAVGAAQAARKRKTRLDRK